MTEWVRWITRNNTYKKEKERRWEEEGSLQKRGVGRKFLKVGEPKREGSQAINQTKGQCKEQN